MKTCDEIVIEYHPNFFSYNSDKSIWYTNLSHVPTENDCFTSLFFWSGKKHCRFGRNFSKKSAHRLAWLQLWSDQLIQNPNPKSTHIVFINFWAYPETISKWNYQFWFTHFTLCTIICIWCLAKGGLISDGICFRPQNVPNHSPKQNFPPMTLANNLFAQEIDLAPYIGNATKVEIPFEIKPPLSGPSIKEVSSNFSFLTPPTYPCLLFLLNNLM